MKSFRILLAVIAVLSLSINANAQKIFRFGPKVGTEINSMQLNKDVFNSENRAGFTGGLMFEANIPVIGICFDASLMYVHRVSSNTEVGTSQNNANILDLLKNKDFTSRDYIEIPVNIKYRLGLPVVGKIVAPYIFTGPSFGILASSSAINDAYKNKSFDISWNFGLGVQLFTHLQVSASYGLGLTKSIETINKYTDANITTGPAIDGRNKYWTVTAAWLF